MWRGNRITFKQFRGSSQVYHPCRFCACVNVNHKHRLTFDACAEIPAHQISSSISLIVKSCLNNVVPFPFVSTYKFERNLKFWNPVIENK